MHTFIAATAWKKDAVLIEEAQRDVCSKGITKTIVPLSADSEWRPLRGNVCSLF
jgi:hypothetical protein